MKRQQTHDARADDLQTPFDAMLGEWMHAGGFLCAPKLLRVAKLYGRRTVRERAAGVPTDEIRGYVEIVQSWYDDYQHGSLKKDKESSRRGAYIQDFFVTMLGYSEKKYDQPHTLEPEATTEKNQFPDVLLSYTDPKLGIANIAAVVELKGASVSLDRPQQREGNMSPVQQAFKYKPQYRSCPFVIVSNFFEFRLYNDNQLDYEAWTLADLNDPTDDYINFKSWYYLLHADRFTSQSGKSATELLLSDIRQDQEEVGGDFYTDYKEARHVLLHDIWKRNPKTRHQFDRAIEKAQTIIDRIVFSCFAEDRDLLPELTLKRVKKYAENSYVDDPLWTQIKGFFSAVDAGSDRLGIPDGYNGGLFAEDAALNALDISDEPLDKLIDLSGYNFKEDLSVTILGHIFEQSISDLEELKRAVNERGENDEFLIPAAPRQAGRRKKDGIFYTPEYVVRYIVKNSLGAYLEREEEALKKRHHLTDKDTDESQYAERERRVYLRYQSILQNVKVLDPACGSGAFLVHVFDYLIHENQRVDAILGGNLASMDEYVRDILTNNIFGVDINEESVEITQLSLWLKTAMKGKKLTALNDNILCGNTLIEDATVPDANAFNFANAFPKIMQAGGFDVIVGNPPYVRVQNIDRPHTDYFFEKYKTPVGKMDISILFFERALQLLKPDGIAAFVSSSQWMQTDYGKNLRKLLSEGAYLTEIVDFGSLPVFKGASTYPAVFTMLKSGRKELPTYSKLTGTDQLNEGSIIAAPRKEISPKNLNEGPWQFGDFRLVDHLTKVKRKFVEFSEAAHAYIGDLTGRDETFVLTRERAKELGLEKGLLLPYAYRAGQIHRFRTTETESVVIYPYEAGPNGEAVLLTPKVLKSNYPKTYAYLENDRSLLERRLDSRKEYATGDQWFRHLRPGSFNYVDPPKLMIKGIDRRVVMGRIDGSTAFNGANCTGVVLENADYSEKYIYGLFNSKLISYHLNQVCPPKLNNMFRYNANNINAVPIVGKGDQEIEELVGKLVAAYADSDDLCARFRTMMESEVNAKWTQRPFPWWEMEYLPLLKKLKVRASLVKKDEVLDFWMKYHGEVTKILSEINNLEAQLDSRVYDIYKLDEEQIAIVECYFGAMGSAENDKAA